ncbi:MAG: hypothetical protein LUD72_06810, partial [Bacteroidales bacterium]|nr:hypothetical protein [Bacteroidales bacterium]
MIPIGNAGRATFDLTADEATSGFGDAVRKVLKATYGFPARTSLLVRCGGKNFFSPRPNNKEKDGSERNRPGWGKVGLIPNNQKFGSVHSLGNFTENRHMAVS